MSFGKFIMEIADIISSFETGKDFELISKEEDGICVWEVRCSGGMVIIGKSNSTKIVIKWEK